MNAQPMQRVLMMTQYLGVGGLERMILQLGMGLNAHGRFAPSVLSYDQVEGQPTLREEFIEAGIPVFEWRKKPGFSFELVRRLRKLIRDEGISCVHTHDLGPLIYGVLATAGSRIPLVHTQHSFVHLGRKKRHALYERLFAPRASALCVVSEQAREAYIRLGMARDSLNLIENGMSFANPAQDADDLSPKKQGALRLRLAAEAEAGFPQAGEQLCRVLERRWVLCLARVHPGKGQDHLVEIWSRLSSQKRSGMALIFVGPETEHGELARLQKKIRESRCEEIVYAGMTRKPLDWIAASDAFASASEFEGGPLSPVEAMGSGLPVFLSDIPGHRELGHSPVYFDWRAPDSAAALLEGFLDQLQLEKKMERWENSRALRERFGIEAMVSKYEDVYSRVGKPAR